MGALRTNQVSAPRTVPNASMVRQPPKISLYALSVALGLLIATVAWGVSITVTFGAFHAPWEEKVRGAALTHAFVALIADVLPKVMVLCAVCKDDPDFVLLERTVLYPHTAVSALLLAHSGAAFLVLLFAGADGDAPTPLLTWLLIAAMVTFAHHVVHMLHLVYHALACESANDRTESVAFIESDH